jgi:hypothetical protein
MANILQDAQRGEANFSFQVEHVGKLADRFNLNLESFCWKAWVSLGALGLGLYVAEEKQPYTFVLWG